MQDHRQFHNLAIVGFMGTGKSTVGRLVAHDLGFDFVDVDELIEARTGRRISSIFSTDGEPAFRQLESAVVADLGELRKTVIATGGGTVVNPANMASLKSHSLVVCLWASPEVIWQRTRSQSHRPLLQDPDPQAKIRRLLAEREPFYREADVLVNTEQRPLREVGAQVFNHFRSASARSAP